jgi:hypothetical protein
MMMLISKSWKIAVTLFTASLMLLHETRSMAHNRVIPLESGGNPVIIAPKGRIEASKN